MIVFAFQLEAEIHPISTARYTPCANCSRLSWRERRRPWQCERSLWSRSLWACQRSLWHWCSSCSLACATETPPMSLPLAPAVVVPPHSDNGRRLRDAAPESGIAGKTEITLPSALRPMSNPLIVSSFSPSLILPRAPKR